MTIIVSNFKERLLITDRCVIDFEEKTKNIKHSIRKMEDKAHFTDDGYFLYVFDFAQEEIITDSILNHIRAYEEGSLDPDFVFENVHKKRIAMYVYTARAAYYISGNTGRKNINITETYSWLTNFSTLYGTLEALGLTTEEVFDVVVACELKANRGKHVINFKDKLKLIPKKRKTKKKVEEGDKK